MAIEKAVRSLTREDLSEINRALGLIEGLSYGVDSPSIADGLIEVVERIDAIINHGVGERRCDNGQS